MKYYPSYVHVYTDLETLNMKKDTKYFFNMQSLDIYALVLRNIFMACVKKALHVLMKKFIEIHANTHANIENEINCETRSQKNLQLLVYTVTC